MDNLEIREYDDKDKDAVDGFLSSRNDACIFQTPLYFEALKASGNKLARYFIAWRGGKVCGCLLCDILAQRFDKRALISGILDIKGGPLAENNDAAIIRALLDAAKNIRPKALFMQIAPVYDPAPIKGLLMSYGFDFRPHLALQIDLTKSEEELSAAIGKHKYKNIRSAERKGLRFKAVTDKENFDLCLQILKETYERLNLPVPDMAVFAGLAKNMPSNLKIFGIYTPDDKMIAFKSAFCYNNLAYLHLSGSVEDFHRLHPNEFAYYKLIIRAKENGFSILDMGGGGNPDKPYGVRDFKMGFGPQAFNYWHYVRPLRPALMKIAKKTWYFLHRR